MRIQLKAFRLFLPTLADVLVGCQPPKHFESFGEVIGRKELSQMLLELLMRLIVITLDRRLFDCSVHSLDLAVSPWVIDLR